MNSFLWFLAGAGAGVAMLSAAVLLVLLFLRYVRLAEREQRRRKRQDLYSISAASPGPMPKTKKLRMQELMNESSFKALAEPLQLDDGTSLSRPSGQPAEVESASALADIALLSSEHAAAIDLALPPNPLPPRTELGSVQYALQYDADTACLEIAVISARGLNVKPCSSWVRLRAWIGTSRDRASASPLNYVYVGDDGSDSGDCDRPVRPRSTSKPSGSNLSDAEPTLDLHTKVS